MDPMTLLGLGITLVKEGPAAIAFVEQTYNLFSSGTITADQLGQMWTTTVAAVKAANDKWAAAQPVAPPAPGA